MTLRQSLLLSAGNAPSLLMPAVEAEDVSHPAQAADDVGFGHARIGHDGGHFGHGFQ